jgi:IS30 family transposase
MKKYHHYTWDCRLILETMLKDGKTPHEIAGRLGFHISSVYREIKRGLYTHKNSDWTFSRRYSADAAEQKDRANLSAKGAGLKIGNDRAFADFIERKIIQERYSPAAALMDIERRGLQFSVTICVTTLYSYIGKGIFLNLTNKQLPVKSRRAQKYGKVRRRARAPRGESIERRPEEVNARQTFGNWEMDTVKGRRDTKATLLVLTERLTQQEIKARMPDNTAASVVAAVDNLEKRYGAIFPRVFRTITVDNGVEFSDCAGIERSALNPGARTKLYYCHPYSSFERGSNENQNKLVRRWIHKGSPIENYTDADIEYIETWMNNYPRRLLGGKASSDLFNEEMEKLCML